LRLADLVGTAGVLMILVAYAGAAMGRLDPKAAPSLSANLVGAALILFSLSRDFNLSAVLMEGSWALVSLVGLLRLAFRRRA
jgi:O-antigen ligase